jgi:hypothetical protein
MGWAEYPLRRITSTLSDLIEAHTFADGALGCTCKGRIYHASRPQCRHIAAVLAAKAAEPLA